MMWRALFILALVLGSADARADAATIIAAFQYVVGFIKAYGVYIALAYSVYSGVQAGRAARSAERKARNDFNNSLQERMITAVTEAPPERVVYGAGLYGGDVVAIFTSDYTDESGTVKKDGLKHLVVVCASHRIKAIKDILIDGTRLDVTGSAGWSDSPDFSKGYDNTKTDDFPGTGTTHTVSLSTFTGGRVFGTLSPVIVTVQANWNETVNVASPSDYSLSGSTLTLPAVLNGITIDATWTWHVTYSFGGASVSEVYVSKFLGSDTQAADAWLMSQVPALWTSTDRLRGRAGAVITLNLKQQRFQGGIPRILFDLEGRDEIYDPRDGTYKYTTNAALCTDDWLRSRWGFGVVPSEAATIVAANACDVSIPFTVYAYPPDGIGPPGPTTGSAARYTINGSFTAAQDKESVLRDLLLSMAGKAINGAEWVILAGAWTTPVREIVDGDDMGPLQIAQAGAPMDELFNGMRGTYVPYGESTTAEVNPPYQNATLVAADGQELWEDLTFPYTDNANRATNLARIAVEVARNGLTIVYPAKLKHWDLEVGQRVYVTNAEYGFTRKTFQIVNWEFSQDSAVLLTMQEDAEAAYDNEDSGIADPTPNSDLADPNNVPSLTGLAAVAGTAELDRSADGGIVSRMRVSWTTSTAPYMDGDAYVEVAWQNPSVNSALWNLVKVPPLDNEVLVTGVQDGTNVAVRTVAVNSLGRRSVPVFSACYIFGKTVVPAAVAGFALSIVPGALKGVRTPSTEADYDHTEYRYGASFASGTKVPGTSDRSGFEWKWPPFGTYTVWAVDYDTSGNAGPATISATIVVDSTMLVTGVYGSSIAGPSYVTATHHTPTNGLGFWDLIGSLTFTPDPLTSGSVEILLTATGQCNLTAGVSGSDFCVGYLGDNTSTTPDDAAIQLVPITLATLTDASGFAHSLRITHAGNTSVTVGFWAQIFGSGAGSSCYITNLNLRAEVIKR